MADLENPHVRRLYDSVAAYGGEEAARAVACAVPLSKTPNEKKKAQWVDSVLHDLHERFDEDTVRRIRMGCACGPSPAQREKLRKLYLASGSLEAFAARCAKSTDAYSMWCEDGALYFSYPTCYCSMVKHRDVPDAKTWCLCTVGYTKGMFDYVFDRDVDVELLESVKQGHARCLMRVSAALLT